MEREEALIGNERIEEAILALQREPSEEQLARTLTAIRRRAREDGHVLVAVKAADTPELATVRTADGREWFAAFTSFEQELKGGDSVMSAFTARLSDLMPMALGAAGVAGVILNPWERTLMLDKTLIRIVLGETK